MGNVTVQQVPITSVTLTALNADGTAASTSIPYGTTGGIKLSASCDAKPGAGELSCQWYTIGGTLQLIDGAKGTGIVCPTIFLWELTSTASPSRRTATQERRHPHHHHRHQQDRPHRRADAEREDATYGQALSAIKLSGTMKDGDKTVPGTSAWADGTVKPSAGSYEAAWKFTPTDGDTYAETTGTVTITVNKGEAHRRSHLHQDHRRE